MTQDFLNLFTGSQIFVSKPDKVAGPPWHYHEDYSTAEAKLRDRESFDWGSFFCVNELDRSLDAGTVEKPKKRTKKMFVRARAIFLDFDKADKKPPENFPIPPSVTVTSSEGKYHFYWLTETTDPNEWNQVMEGLTNSYDGDPQAKDLARILRLPGFHHNKYDPFMVTCEIHNTKPYSWEEIKKAFPPTKTDETVNRGASGKDSPVVLNIEGITGVVGSPAQTVEGGDSFNTVDAINKILNAESYHGPLTSLSMRYVNRNMERDEIFTIFKGLGSIANKREEWESRFSDEHLYECIDSAIAKKIEEDKEKTTAHVPHSHATNQLNNIPVFPEDLMNDWPAPWPMLWANYKKLPRTLDQSLLVPTILTMHSYWLNSRYVNEWGKRPNMAFLAVAPSTGNKDVNSKDMIETVRSIMIERDANFFFFSGLLGFPHSITSETAFIQSFNEAGDLFWLSTEATYIFQQLATSKGNSSMRALESKMIEVVDGGPIHGKQKAGETIKSIEDPNAQVLLYAQPETIREYLQDSIIDSGLLGRFMIHIPIPSTDKPFANAFIRRSEEQKDVSDDFARFFTDQGPKNPKKIELRPSNEDLKDLQAWMDIDIDNMSDGDQHVKLLRRLAVSAEQLYTMVLGTMRHWDNINEQDPRDSFDVKCLMPLLNYWAECKVYALNEFVDESVDPLSDAIEDVVFSLITGKIKSPKYAHIIKKHNAVPRTEVDRVIQSRKKLIQQLDSRNDMKNVRMRTQGLIDMFCKNGTMILFDAENGKRKLLGFTKDHEPEEKK